MTNAGPVMNAETMKRGARSAELENGLLDVDLVREIPETKKPRQIPINGKSDD